MTTTELRIGNLVRLDTMLRNELFDSNEVVTETDTFPIAMIDTMFLNLYINEAEYEFTIADINPVPLTRDILIDMGFERQEATASVDSWVNHSMAINTYSKTEVDYYWLRHYQARRTKHIKYVHQLQNLYFALIGEELTYNKQ